MRCPACNSAQTKVVDSRLRERINTVYRRRRCLKCRHGWQTNEIDVTELEQLRAFYTLRQRFDEFIETAAKAVATVNKMLSQPPDSRYWKYSKDSTDSTD